MKALRILMISIALFATYPAGAETPPTELLQDTATRVIERLHASQPLSDEQAYALVEDLIFPHLDFDGFARLTLGKYWRQASPEQRTTFTREFRDLLMRTYATSLNSYSGEKIEQQGQRDEGDGRILLQTLLVRTQGAAVRVDYRLHQRDGEWKVYDVVIDGISLVMTYRTSFGEEISRSGLDALIQKMADHKLKAGCLASTRKDCESKR